MRLRLAGFVTVVALLVSVFTSTESWAQTISVRVAANNDDSEESSTGVTTLGNASLRIGQQRWVGMRFHDVGLPKNCTILSAHIEFTANATNSQATQLTIFAQAHDDSSSFGSADNYISNLAKTAASVEWTDVQPWTSGTVYESEDIAVVLQELVTRAGWATNSDINLLLRSDDLAGNRSCHSHNGNSANAPLLVVEYTTSVSSNTPTSDRLYVELSASRFAPAASAWQTIDLSAAPYNVPANKVVEVAIHNADTANEQWGGVRAVGSSLERRLQLHEAESGGVDAVVMHVQTNSSSQIQVYASSTTYVTFQILGYWTSGIYAEKMQSFASGAAWAWVDKNLGAYGVGANQVAEIVLTNANAANEFYAGVRVKGSILDRVALLHEAQDGGVDATTMFVRANASSDATIQVATTSTTDVTFYLIGYWKYPPGKFTEKFIDLGVPTSTNVWQDKNLTASAVPAKAVCSVMLANTEAGAENSLGVRENGSTNSRRLLLHQAKDGGGDYARVHITADASSTIEWYSQKTDSNKVDFLLSGYWEKAPGNILVVVANKQSPSTQALERLTLLEGWGYTATLIDDDDPQGDYDAAVACHTCVYLPLEVNASVVTKLASASIAIVSEHASLIDDLGFAQASAPTTSSSITITDNTHYVTSPFSTGALSIFNVAQAVTTASGEPALQLQSPASWGSSPALLTMEAGARSVGDGRLLGRHVQLPWGGSGFDITQLNSNGKTLMRRSFQWAMGLKAYWKLNETSGTTATDSSGHQNHAALSSGANFSVDAILGKRDGGLSFNGATGYVAAPASPSLEFASSISAAMWLKPNSVNLAYLLTKDNSSSFYFRLNSNGSLTFGNGSSGWQVTSGAGAVQSGSWQHVAGTYDASTGKGMIFVDGIAVTTQTGLSGTVGINALPAVIGSKDATSSDRFSGSMDEVRIYDHALSASEVSAVKKSAVSGVRVRKWVEVQ